MTRNIQRVCWIYVTANFKVKSFNDVKLAPLGIDCRLLPITSANYERVREFREEGRVAEYRDKLHKGEVGYFAESNGRTIGSIWASVNSSTRPEIAKMYMKLMPGEALIHDIVASPRAKGNGIGPFMVRGMVTHLLSEHRAGGVVIDVSRRNRPSLRMMEKIGLKVKEHALYISLFGTLAFHRLLWRDELSC